MSQRRLGGPPPDTDSKLPFESETVLSETDFFFFGREGDREWYQNLKDCSINFKTGTKHLRILVQGFNWACSTAK